MVDSADCIFVVDFDALRFEKNDFEGSLTCLGADSGEEGKGGREVKEGEVGEADSVLEWSAFVSVCWLFGPWVCKIASTR